MGILISVIIIVLIAALKTGKEKQVHITITDSDVMHPAEFEMRDHFLFRCSE